MSLLPSAQHLFGVCLFPFTRKAKLVAGDHWCTSELAWFVCIILIYVLSSDHQTMKTASTEFLAVDCFWRNEAR